jgi:hypothetical protein
MAPVVGKIAFSLSSPQENKVRKSRLDRKVEKRKE